MLKKIKCAIILSTSLLSISALAHGEKIFGPHKGYIRMPGTFHTELVAQKDGSFLIYLLDLQNKNPSANNSSVVVQIKTENKTIQLECMVMDNYFHCPNSAVVKKGEVRILANRQGVKAGVAIYELPLQLKSADHDMSKMK